MHILEPIRTSLLPTYVHRIPLPSIPTFIVIIHYYFIFLFGSAAVIVGVINAVVAVAVAAAAAFRIFPFSYFILITFSDSVVVWVHRYD